MVLLFCSVRAAQRRKKKHNEDRLTNNGHHHHRRHHRRVVVESSLARSLSRSLALALSPRSRRFGRRGCWRNEKKKCESCCEQDSNLRLNYEIGVITKVITRTVAESILIPTG
jgi:hypothetical protein